MSLIVAESTEAATVDCGAGDVQCLVDAINRANADPHHTTIRLAGGTYSLSAIDNLTNGANGLPTIISTLTIKAGGEGATLARAAGAPPFRLLHVGSTGRLTLEGIQFIGGASLDTPSFERRGGALRNDGGTVTIVNCLFDNNHAPFGDGGAVFTSLGTLTLSDSAFVRNGAGTGGALVNDRGLVTVTRTRFNGNFALDAGSFWTEGETHISQSRIENNSSWRFSGLFVHGGTAAITETTFSGNSGGGALMVDRQSSVIVRDSAFVSNRPGEFDTAIAIFNRGNTEVINTTFARNELGGRGRHTVIANEGRILLLSSTCAENGTSFPGFIFFLDMGAIESSPTATTLLQNTIVVHSDPRVTEDCGGGGYTSLGNNLIGDPAGCNMLLRPDDLIGEANLGPLTDDGTPGNAHYPLQPLSQAIDAANQEGCTKKDQIGQPRRPRCDIGAVDFR